mgnify:CR=1 FL=1
MGFEIINLSLIVNIDKSRPSIKSIWVHADIPIAFYALVTNINNFTTLIKNINAPLISLIKIPIVFRM